MTEWEDYYKILQVHYLAEPEVIESAYRRLAKKYHPDINKDKSSEAHMRLINRAYEELKNPVSRKQYFLRWIEKNSGIENYTKQQPEISVKHIFFEPVKEVLEGYLGSIKNRKYGLAYDRLSEKDKKSIRKKDFIKWQTKVAEIFELKSYEGYVKGIYANLQIKDGYYEAVAQMSVKVLEYNHLMDRLEEDEFPKTIVLENNEWKVFLGYKELDTATKKFNELANLKNVKFSEKKRIQKLMNIDGVSGLLNKKGFDEKAECEQERRNRYGNEFSLILCEIDESAELRDNRLNIVGVAGNAIKTSLRKLDSSCRWKGCKFLILLPETSLTSAKCVARKIQINLKEAFKYQDNTAISASFVVAQQQCEFMDEIIRSMNFLMRERKKRNEKNFVIMQKY